MNYYNKTIIQVCAVLSNGIFECRKRLIRLRIILDRTAGELVWDASERFVAAQRWYGWECSGAALERLPGLEQ